MSQTFRSAAIFGTCVLALTVAVSAHAQSGSSTTTSGQTATTSQSSIGREPETRPATTTFLGDTGLWFVPTAEILPDSRWSVSGYRTNWDYRQGLTDVSHFPITFAVGLADRVEIFGSFRVDTRIDRDFEIPATFQPTNASYGGLVNAYPYVRRDWSGDNVGDLLVGLKVNLTSQWRQQPVAMAIRGTVKLPTGNKDSGAGTGKADAMIDFILSKEFNKAKWAEMEVRSLTGAHAEKAVSH